MAQNKTKGIKTNKKGTINIMKEVEDIPWWNNVL